MKTVTPINTIRSSVDGLEEFDLNGQIVLGTIWTGTNLFAIIQLVGQRNTPGLEKGVLNIYGRPVNVGDFVYTTVDKEQFDYYPHSATFQGLPPELVFVIEQGEWQYGET